MTAPVVTGTTIGRYFTVVSLVPSVAFVAYATLLVRSGAWGGNVNFADVAPDFNIKDLALFGIGSLLVAMTLHPLQFTFIQTFEGFWGGFAFGQKLAIRHTCATGTGRETSRIEDSGKVSSNTPSRQTGTTRRLNRSRRTSP